MSQQLKLKIAGLYTNPNDLSSVPEGALAVANNVVIEKESIVETRKGQNFYGNKLNLPSGQINKLFNYKRALLVHADNTLSYDSDNNGNWVAYTGTYLAPEVATQIRSLESNRNFYFTTSKGIFKLDTLTSTPMQSGAPRGLDGSGVVTGSVGFMPDDTQVAYRVVWGYKDASSNLIIGSPSQRIIVSNSAGASRNVNVTFTIPARVTSNWFYQVYRSSPTGSITSSPDDNLQLVLEKTPTAGEITARELTVLDNTPEDLKGATLYTSPSQQGIAQANEEPPLAKDVAVFKNHAFYANCKSKQRLTLTLISVGSNSLKFKTSPGDRSNTSNILSNLSGTSDMRVGMRVIGTDIPLDTRIASIDSATQITMTEAATSTATGMSLEFQDRLSISTVDYFAGSTQNVSLNQFKVETSLTPAENINETALSIIEVVNKTLDNTTVYAYYLSGFNDLPGKIQIEEIELGGADFPVTSTAGSSFSPTLPTTGTTVNSDNDERANRIYISKVSQPEAVPLLNSLDIGSQDFPILRAIALRDSIFVFKADGIYRITGESVGNFRVTLFDSTSVLRAPESAVAFNNQVFTFSDQGVIAVSDTGVAVVSRPIEDQLLEISSEQYTNFETATFAVAYESSRQYILFTVTQTADSYATQAYVYNSFTKTWTRWNMNRSCGIVNRRDNKLYMGHPTNDYVYKERKNFNLSDYSDEQYEIEITNVDETLISVADANNVSIGQTLKQGFRESVILSIDGNVLTVNNILGYANGIAEVHTPIATEIKWVPMDIENPGILKRFREITLLFRDAAFIEASVGFSTNFSPDVTSVSIRPISKGSFGSTLFGSDPFGGGIGGSQALRTLVPLEKARGSWLNISVSTAQAFTSFSLSGISIVFNSMTERFK